MGAGFAFGFPQILPLASDFIDKTRHNILNYFDMGAMGVSDLNNCENNDRINITIKDMFNQSPSAQQLNLKALQVTATNRNPIDDALLSCKAKILTNNGTNIYYNVSFTMSNNQILVTGSPDMVKTNMSNVEQDMKQLENFINDFNGN